MHERVNTGILWEGKNISEYRFWTDKYTPVLAFFLNKGKVYFVNPADGVPLDHGKVHLVAHQVPEDDEEI